MSTLPIFDEVADALAILSSLGSAAESHGLLCALLSFNNKIRESAWVDSLLNSHIEGTDTHAQQAYRILTNLFRETAKAFDSDSFDLPILIPDDDCSLEDRIDGLAEWCQGYLTGLHLMGVKLQGGEYSPELQEALNDVLAISEIEFTTEDATDPESEIRFMQLVEHVKVALACISDELKATLSHRDSNSTVH